MGAFRLIDHIADVGVASTGSTLAEALAWAARGMFSLIADIDRVETREWIHVSVKSTDADALAVDWLNELLYRHEAEGFLIREPDVVVGEDGASLTATCGGERIDPARHGPLGTIKAATYHKLEVSRNCEWLIRVFLDV